LLLFATTPLFALGFALPLGIVPLAVEVLEVEVEVELLEVERVFFPSRRSFPMRSSMALGVASGGEGLIRSRGEQGGGVEARGREGVRRGREWRERGRGDGEEGRKETNAQRGWRDRRSQCPSLWGS
jgi:hypothetical protein